MPIIKRSEKIVHAVDCEPNCGSCTNITTHTVKHVRRAAKREGQRRVRKALNAYFPAIERRRRPGLHESAAEPSTALWGAVFAYQER